MKKPSIKTVSIFSLCAALLLLPFEMHAQRKYDIRTGMNEIKEKHNVSFVYDSSLEPRFSKTIQHPKSNSRLERSLEHIFKDSGIIWEIQEGNQIVLKLPQKTQVIELEPEHLQDTLNASIITSEKYLQKLRSTSTGIEKIDGSAFNRGFAVLSSPDVIKTIQALPGVANGTELLSGMFVHGGTGYDNLYLLDGVPLYQVSHLAGLFSSFNTDIIDNVDFYKSGFPARFGGRMSSVVDVTTKDGDMNDYHGHISIGLLEGRIQFDGPIIKNKTSFNIAMRRSWIDVFSTPVLAIINRTMVDKTNLHYSLVDFNAKITHLFAPDNKLTVNTYHGRDRLKYGFDYVGQYEDGKIIPGSEDLTDSDGLGLNWGNTLASLRWENKISDALTSDIKAFYSRYTSETDYYSYYWIHEGDGIFHKEGGTETGGSQIHDIAAKADFKWSPSSKHDVRFGTSYEHHIFKGFRSHEVYVPISSKDNKTLTSKGETGSNGNEMAVYIEDDINITRWMKAGLGLRYVVFAVQDKKYHRLEPRASLNFTLHKSISMKFSYTEMNQYIHNISTSNLDLPTNIWMPSTAKVAPMNSRQIAAGFYSLLQKGFTFDIEGYFKTMDHLREYNGYSMLYPPLEEWENEYPEGKGLSYGTELTLGYNTNKANFSAAYTLSWTKRKFEDIYPDWYLNWNDNRHKLTLSASWKISDKIDIYSAWNYKSGNRISVDAYDNDFNHVISYLFPFKGIGSLAGTPYNLVLPSYHRLDLGANFRKTTKNGRQSIWNVSIYNAYCRMNPMYAYIKTDENGNTYGVATGIVPIIPSFSYTLIF